MRVACADAIENKTKLENEVITELIEQYTAFATSALSLSLRAWHAMVSLARRGTHDVLVLRKGTGAVTLGGAVDRAQLFCQKWTTLLSEESVRSSQASAPRAGRVPTTAISLGI